MEAATMKIERSIVIKADQAKVWKALTTPEALAKWFEVFDFDRLEVGQKIHFSWEPNDAVDFSETSGEIAMVEPISRFGYRWRIAPPEPAMTLVIFDLETVPEGTRVTVTETGFEAISDAQREKRFNDNMGGWQGVMGQLAAYLQGQAISIERSIWIKASRQRVWEAITDPAQIGAWFSPGTHWRGTGLEVGGRISVYDPETDTDLFTQVITLVDAPNQLVTCQVPNSADEASHTTTWTLKEDGSGTLLTLTYSGYEMDTEDARQHNMDENAVGFGLMLENVKAHVEGQPLPHPQGF